MARVRISCSSLSDSVRYVDTRRAATDVIATRMKLETYIHFKSRMVNY